MSPGSHNTNLSTDTMKSYTNLPGSEMSFGLDPQQSFGYPPPDPPEDVPTLLLNPGNP